MSNPAVIKLQSGRVSSNKVWLDDNFGESIHIHIDDYRVDLTVDEFRQLYNDLCVALTKMINVKGFDVSQIDPVYISVMLWPRLSHLKKISYDKVKLESLYAPYHSHIYRLKDSIGYKSLERGQTIKEKRRVSQLIGQTETQRMESILMSIKEKGYPSDKHYIIVYGNDNIIRDGQHRASCLYYLYGNIEVPIIRLFFDNYNSPNLKNLFIYNTISYIKSYIKNIIKTIRNFLKLIIEKPNETCRLTIKKITHFMRAYMGHSEYEEDLKALFLSK